MVVRNTAAVCLACMCGMVSARAESSIDLHFKDGRVWIHVVDAPAPQILREWSRIGGTTIVNGEAVAGPPLTFQLIGVPESEALDTILRDTAGHVSVLRTSGSDGPAQARQILIVPKTPAAGVSTAAGPPRGEPAPSMDDDTSGADLPRSLDDVIRAIQESVRSAK